MIIKNSPHFKDESMAIMIIFAGYMWEYPVAKAFADGRVTRIYGGSNEIMKELISRGI